MKKEFYIGQPLIIKGTGEKVVLLNNDGKSIRSISVWNGNERIYCHSDDLEPSTEFTFSEIIAGLEQGYFDVGAEFQSECQTFVVRKTPVGLGLREKEGEDANIHAGSIHGHWALVEHHKEMTLEEIEAELGYKIKLK